MSATNGCGQCLDAPERQLRQAVLARETIQDAALDPSVDAEAVLRG